MKKRLKFLKNKIILVTGSEGFIGGHVKEELLKLPIKKLLEIDLKNGYNILDERFNFDLDYNEKIDYIIHQAGYINATASIDNPVECFKQNLLGTLNILEYARKNKVKHVVIASSAAVYGDTRRHIKPINPYGLSKYFIEELAEYYCRMYNMNITCLRYSNVFGTKQGLECKPIIPILITRLMRNEIINLYNKGENIRDFIYVKDVVIANLLSLELEGFHYGNISSGIGVKIIDLCRVIQYLLNIKYTNIRLLDKKEGDIEESILANGYCELILNWKPKQNFIKNLRTTINYYKRLEN